MYVARALRLCPGDRSRLVALTPATASAELLRRGRIVLLAAEGVSNAEIARRTGTSRPTVVKWRERYAEAGIDGLVDLPRPGRRPRIDEVEVLAETLAERGKPPPELGAARWSSRLLAARLGISFATVARIWRKWNVQPHRIGTFAFSTDPVLAPAIRDVVGIYLGPSLAAVVLSADERDVLATVASGPEAPCQGGREPLRGGDGREAKALFAALEIAADRVGTDAGPQRGRAAFVAFLRQAAQSHTGVALHVVCDRYRSPGRSVRTWLARNERITLHRAPPGISWLTMVEIFFGIAFRQGLRRGDVVGVEGLVDALRAFALARPEPDQVFTWIEAAADPLARANDKAFPTHGCETRGADRPAVSEAAALEPVEPEVDPRPWHGDRHVTINDVAQACGVAASTVSRAFSKPGRVSAVTRSRILGIAHGMGYQPNPIARALPLGRTTTIGLLVPDITSFYHTGLVRGAEWQASARGYLIVLADTQGSADVESKAADRLRRAVDGLVLLSPRMPDAEIGDLSHRCPVVLVNRVVESVPRVIVDPGAAVREVLVHLVSLGHRRLAYLAGSTVSWSNTRRVASLRGAARELGVRLVALKLPASPDAPVVLPDATAVIAFNDVLAIGLLQRLAALGVRVPEEISVAGADDAFGAAFCTPPLTTTRAPTEDAGRIAVDLLLATVTGSSPPPEDEVRLHASLVVRESTGPAPVPAAAPGPRSSA